MSPFVAVAAAIACSLCSSYHVEGFTTTTRSPLANTFLSHQQRGDYKLGQAASPTALNVWWFGGNDNTSELNEDGDSCELVAVRIERTSANSRKIAGSITVGTPLADVWAILTDYDRLSVHVPNLVESRIISKQSQGEMGDGSFRCKLFQKGAQKIVGFEFGASVTMDMAEKIVKQAAVMDDSSEAHAHVQAMHTQEERLIGFKCVDSFFFSEFDGEWRAKEQINADGEVETVLDYVVDVRPKGPVPVAALEWRIREDVPTNLRAVKKAAQEVGLEGVLASRRPVSTPATRRVAPRAVTVTAAPQRTRPTVTVATNGARQPRQQQQRQQPQLQTTNAIRRATVRLPRLANPLLRRRDQAATVMASTKETLANNRAQRAAAQKEKKPPLPFQVNWEQDETMAAYLAE